MASSNISKSGYSKVVAYVSRMDLCRCSKNGNGRPDPVCPKKDARRRNERNRDPELQFASTGVSQA